MGFCHLFAQISYVNDLLDTMIDTANHHKAIGRLMAASIEGLWCRVMAEGELVFVIGTIRTTPCFLVYPNANISDKNAM